MTYLVEAKRLKKYFPVRRSLLEGVLGKRERFLRAVDDVTIGVEKGTVLALVGESGSGKTTFGKLTLRVHLPSSGSVTFNGKEVASFKDKDLESFRRSAQMVYQDPTAALNPRITIGEAIRQPLEFNRLGSVSDQKERALKIMERVGLLPAEEFYSRFPHELSGGQRQRVVIARALVLDPVYLVADEPVAMLDVSVRAQILKLILELKQELDLTMLIITHDLAIAKYFSDNVAIMYLGQIVERGSRQDTFVNPMHPYTKALISSVPVPDPERKRERLMVPGDIPSAINPPPACRFHTRCPFVFERCRVDEPALVERSPGHFVACHLYDKK